MLVIPRFLRNEIPIKPSIRDHGLGLFFSLKASLSQLRAGFLFCRKRVRRKGSRVKDNCVQSPLAVTWGVFFV